MSFFRRMVRKRHKWRDILWTASDWGDAQRMDNYVAHHCRCAVTELQDGEFCLTASYLHHMGVLVLKEQDIPR